MLGAFPESSILWFWRGFSHYFLEPDHVMAL